jgi:hypothetical protein
MSKCGHLMNQELGYCAREWKCQWQAAAGVTKRQRPRQRAQQRTKECQRHSLRLPIKEQTKYSRRIWHGLAILFETSARNRVSELSVKLNIYFIILPSVSRSFKCSSSAKWLHEIYVAYNSSFSTRSTWPTNHILLPLIQLTRYTAHSFFHPNAKTRY